MKNLCAYVLATAFLSLAACSETAPSVSPQPAAEEEMALPSDPAPSQVVPSETVTTMPAEEAAKLNPVIAEPSQKELEREMIKTMMKVEAAAALQESGGDLEAIRPTMEAHLPALGINPKDPKVLKGLGLDPKP